MSTVQKWFPSKAAMRAWKRSQESPMVSRTWRCLLTRQRFVIIKRFRLSVTSVVASQSRTTGRDGWRYTMKRTEEQKIQIKNQQRRP